MSRRKGTFPIEVAVHDYECLEVLDWLAANCTKPTFARRGHRYDTPGTLAKIIRHEAEQLDTKRSRRRNPAPAVRLRPSWYREKRQILEILFRSNDDIMLFTLRWNGLIRFAEEIKDGDK